MTEISETQCFKIIEKKFGDNNFNIKKIDLVPIGHVDGFLGLYYNLNIDIERNGEEKRNTFFIKFIDSDAVMPIIEDIGFPNESFFYTTYQQKLKQLNLHILSDYAPKNYFVEKDQFFALENLELLGFKSHNIRIPATIEELRLLTKALSKFHASSLLAEEILSSTQEKKFRWDKEYPEVFKRFSSEVVDKIIRLGSRTITDVVTELFPEVCKDLSLKEFKKRCDLIFEENLKLMKSSHKFRDAICHGDMWAANVLFRNEDGNVKECKIVDFQFIKYHIPAQDLLMFLYTSTTREIRLKYMDELINLHYSEMKKIFEKFERNFDSVYTYDEFLESYKYIKPQALGQALTYNQTNPAPPEMVKKIRQDPEYGRKIFSGNRKEFVEESVRNCSIHKARLKDSLEDFYELCIELDI